MWIVAIAFVVYFLTNYITTSLAPPPPPTV
jgi:hypothetical protein